jgi:hypothetical protein
MRRNPRKPRPAEWIVHSASVPRRDGPRRLEQAFQILLDAEPGAGCIPATTDEDCNHESRPLCQGVDREAGS